MKKLQEMDTPELAELLKRLIGKIQHRYKTSTGTKLHQKQIAAEAEIEDSELSRAKNPENHLTDAQRRRCIKKLLTAFHIEIDPDSGEFHFQRKLEHLGGEARQEETLFYVYYHLNRSYDKEDRVEKSKLVVRGDEAELTLYDGASGDPRALYQGQVIRLKGREFFLLFDKRKDAVRGAVDDIPALNCFKMQFDELHGDLFIGIFAATGPSCGRAVLQRVKQEDEVEQLVQRRGVDPLVYLLLGVHRIDAGLHAQHPKVGRDQKLLLNALADFQGVYCGYILESRRDRQYIHQLAFELYEGCRIRFWSRVSGENKGTILDFRHKNIVAQFNYQRQQGYFQTQIILNADPPGIEDNWDNEYLLGVYSGVEDGHSPIAGRIMLKRVEQPYTKQLVKRIPLKDERRLRLLLEEEPELRPFLRGELDQYVDAPVILEKFQLLTGRRVKSIGEDFLRQLAGTYYCYHLSTSETEIHAVPLKLSSDGEVIMKDIDAEQHRQNSGSVMKGEAAYFLNHFLSINIHQRNDRNFFIHLLFQVAAKERSRIHHFHGVSSSVSSHNTLRCGREILVREDRPFEELFAERIPISHNGRPSPRFEALNEKHHGLATFLTGRLNNLILPGRDPDEPFDREPTELIYFHSACYYAQHFEFERAKKQLKTAIRHGFHDRELLRRELSAGLLCYPEMQEAIDVDTLVID